MFAYYLAAASSSVNIPDLLGLMGVVVATASVTSGGLVAWINTRRRNSGKIETSEASVLWQQSQKMREELTRRAERAEDQRDRLLSSYSTELIPMISSISKNQSLLTESVSDVLTILRATGPLPPGNGNGKEA